MDQKAHIKLTSYIAWIKSKKLKHKNLITKIKTQLLKYKLKKKELVWFPGRTFMSLQ